MCCVCVFGCAYDGGLCTDADFLRLEFDAQCDSHLSLGMLLSNIHPNSTTAPTCYPSPDKGTWPTGKNECVLIRGDAVTLGWVKPAAVVPSCTGDPALSRSWGFRIAVRGLRWQPSYILPWLVDVQCRLAYVGGMVAAQEWSGPKPSEDELELCRSTLDHSAVLSRGLRSISDALLSTDPLPAGARSLGGNAGIPQVVTAAATASASRPLLSTDTDAAWQLCQDLMAVGQDTTTMSYSLHTSLFGNPRRWGGVGRPVVASSQKSAVELVERAALALVVWHAPVAIRTILLRAASEGPSDSLLPTDELHLSPVFACIHALTRFMLSRGHVEKQWRLACASASVAECGDVPLTTRLEQARQVLQELDLDTLRAMTKLQALSVGDDVAVVLASLLERIEFEVTRSPEEPTWDLAGAYLHQARSFHTRVAALLQVWAVYRSSCESNLSCCVCACSFFFVFGLWLCCCVSLDLFITFSFFHG
jgi:hypothetical protein